MLKKLLIKALSKHFKKLSPDEKEKVRDMVNETKSETVEKQKKVNKRRKKIMADEKEVKKEPEVEPEKEKTEETKVEETEKTEKSNGEVEKSEDKKEEVATKSEEVEKPADDKEPTEQVEELANEAEGIRIEDLVTKDVFEAKLAAFEAKFNAVVKENEDLKNKLSEMEDKYENKDFGNMSKQGVMAKDKDANSTFDEYSKNFM